MGKDDGEFENPVADSVLFESEVDAVPNAANPNDWGDLSLAGIKRGEVDDFILNYCKNACASNWLDAAILICIIFNTFMLAYAGPANTYPEEQLTAMMISDIILTVIFSVEMGIRIIALGFYDATGQLPVPRYMNECATSPDPNVFHSFTKCFVLTHPCCRCVSAATGTRWTSLLLSRRG